MKTKIKKLIMPLVLIFLLPQLTNLITCSMMNDKQLREIPSAVYLGDNTTLTRAILQGFEEHEVFDVKYYVKNPNEIEKLMSDGRILFGLVVPQNFTKDIKNFKSPNLMCVIDGTQLSAASALKKSSSEILLATKVYTLINLMQGKFNMSLDQAKNAVMPIDITSRILGNPTGNYINFLLPGIMIAMVQVGIAMAASAAVNSNQCSKFHLYITGRIASYFIMGYISVLMILGVQVSFFGLPFKAKLYDVLILCAVFTFAVVSIGIMLSVIFRDKVFASQVAAIYFIPSSILSGYTWPLLSMPEFFQKFALLMPFTHFGDTLRDLILSGSSAFYENNIITLLGIGAISLIIIAIIDPVRKFVLNKGGSSVEVHRGG